MYLPTPFFKTERTMTYVVGERCIKCKTTDYAIGASRSLPDPPSRAAYL
jgi:hypothetical protein